MTSAPPPRRAIPVSIKLAVALRALGLRETEINWSHEPALGLRAFDDRDYDPPQHDPEYIFIRTKPKHDEITFKDNGTGRSDLGAIAHVKRVARNEAEHRAEMTAKLTGQDAPVLRRVKRNIPSRGFSKQQRPLRGRKFNAQRT